MNQIDIPCFDKSQGAVNVHNITASQKYFKHVRAIKNVFNDLILDEELNYIKVFDLSEAILADISENLNFNLLSNNLYSLDDCIYIHSINTAIYSMYIGKWIGLPVNQLKKIILGGLLHDIGKAKIPKKILNKKGTLSKEEMQVIRKHPFYGYEIVDQIPGIDPGVKEAVLLHHERMDGSGYPFSYSGQSIGLYARIVAIADVFDAMTSDRVYKKGVKPEEAFRMFGTAGFGLFDNQIVEVFLKNITYYFTKNTNIREIKNG